ncbi:MAG: glycosyltransferase [Rubricoccaceae bacterium]
MPPRRLALLGPLPPYRGGIAHFNVGVARGLGARGHRLRLVTFSRQYPRVLFPGATEFEPGPVAPDVAGERLLDSVGPRSWRRVARALAADGTEAVLFPYWLSFFAPMWGALARALRRQGVPAVGIVHNARSHERRPGERLAARYALGRTRGLLVLSDQVRADVEALRLGVPVRQAVHPTYNQFGAPVPRAEARAALGLPAHAPVLLFFGFVRRYKGLHVLLEALPRIRAALPDVRLVVAGEFYADEQAIRAQVARLGLGDVVRFDAAYIPAPRVATYFGAADLVVQPYVAATQSGVAHVAFHFARPVLTTDVGGLAEAVPDGEAGLVVPPEQPEALAEAAVRFFREGLAARLEAGAARQRDAHGWAPLLDALEALLEGALVPAASGKAPHGGGLSGQGAPLSG